MGAVVGFDHRASTPLRRQLQASVDLRAAVAALRRISGALQLHVAPSDETLRIAAMAALRYADPLETRLARRAAHRRADTLLTTSADGA